VKRRELLDRIAKASRKGSLEFVLVREGGEHTLYRCGGQQFTVPRHAEINEITARSILRHLEPVLGKGWWR